MKPRGFFLLIGAALLIATGDSRSHISDGSSSPLWVVPDNPSLTTLGPCPIFRKAFRLVDQPVAATARIVGLGHFEFSVNGKRVGESLINQPWSQYDRTLYWQEFDLGTLLHKGENVLGVRLGNSFWSVGAANDTGRFVKTDAMPDFSAGHPYMLWADVHITMKSGRELNVASDGSWKWAEGALTFSHIYSGEDFDARRVQPGWNAPGFDYRTWRSVAIASTPSASLAPYTGPPIKAFEVFQHTRIYIPNPGEYTYVFPQNCSALLRFTVSGAAGATIRFKPCEYMDPTGHVQFTYTWGTKKEIWHDYTLRGTGDEAHQILFCYVGAQYVGVTGAVPAGYPNPRNLPVVKDLELVHVRAANSDAGNFSCSSALQNGAYRMIDWSIRSNMSYVATDCPHREKNGWQEENWHMARAMSYRFDVQSWYAKIARDLRDTQLPDGHIPTNCPNYLVGIPPHGYWNESPEWGISGVLVPWHLFEWYGNSEVLAASFESMCHYVDYLSSQAKNGIITSNLGDWYDYGHGKGDGPSQWTPNEVSATAIWALGAKVLSHAAAILGKAEAAKKYGVLFDQVREDFQRNFYDPAAKTVRNNGSCQAAHSLALTIGLVPEGERPAVLQAIVDDLEQRGWQQTVGEVTQVLFLRALAEGNRNDVLHRVYSRVSRGSYGFMVQQGFTTLPESWDARPGTANSMNHFMLGHLMEWQFAYVAGIRQQSGSIGWRRILVAPNPGDLDSASASFASPVGLIAVEWKQSKAAFSMKVTIPKGINAEAMLPDGTLSVLPPGTTELRSETKSD